MYHCLFCGFSSGVSLRVSQFCKNKSKSPTLRKVMPIFSVGKIIYWVANFGQWAGLIYWVGKVIY